MKKNNEKKMKLNLDDLKVDTFVTSSDLKTVAGGATGCYYHTCTYSCGQLTCNGGPC